jgi:predicted RNase H-like HicB family nuclease/predicted RNA binding protein YcfA (HicA-like mRNA interferase family)
MSPKIRDIIRQIEQDGWFLVATRGSHRQFKHPIKFGRVTIAGHAGDELAPSTLIVFSNRRNSKQRSDSLHRFFVVIEKAESNYSAYSPDLPGCAATGKTREDVETNMHEAMHFHIHGLREDNMAIPENSSFAEIMAIAA